MPNTPPRPPSPLPESQVVSLPRGIRADVISRIDAYADLIAQASAKTGVGAAEIKGVIAAETGGKADSVSSSGYRGVMQAGRTPEHDKPEVSIAHGAQKLKDFWGSLGRLLQKEGVDLEALRLDRWERLRWLACGFNAGPGTVQMAVRYARQAGDPLKWREAEHYQRALLYHGAYAEEPYVPKGQEAHGEAWRKKLRYRNLTIEQARREAPAYILTAVEKKWAHTAGYVERIVTYARYYAEREGPHA